MYRRRDCTRFGWYVVGDISRAWFKILTFEVALQNDRVDYTINPAMTMVVTRSIFSSSRIVKILTMKIVHQLFECFESYFVTHKRQTLVYIHILNVNTSDSDSTNWWFILIFMKLNISNLFSFLFLLLLFAFQSYENLSKKNDFLDFVYIFKHFYCWVQNFFLLFRVWNFVNFNFVANF